MKKIQVHLFLECFLLCFLFFLLFYSKECIELSSKGLLIWFQKMIPSLFPFMILSGFMIRCGFSYQFGNLLKPFLGTVFQLPVQMLYIIFMGFLCGFPMGAKVISDMIQKNQITTKEGTFLLAFCNNIGPLYLLGYVFPLLHPSKPGKLLLLMYGVPFFYGIFLRYFTTFKYRNKNTQKIQFPIKQIDYISELYDSLNNAIEQITLLGGCMIFFNCLQIFPLFMLNYNFPFIQETKGFIQGILCSLTEIGGGLACFVSDKNVSFSLQNPILIPISLFLLTFGGISCLFQTYFILKNTDLSIFTYIKHKLIQSFLIFILSFIFI